MKYGRKKFGVYHMRAYVSAETRKAHTRFATKTLWHLGAAFGACYIWGLGGFVMVFCWLACVRER
jgi:hypothetical protein